MAEKLELKKKKELARTLYMSNAKLQSEIADMVGVSKVTISKWVNTEKWDIERSGATITREKQITMFYRQIAAINEAIENSAEKYPNSHQADIISKIANSIHKLENEANISDVISVAKKITTFVGEMDREKAKEITNIFDNYIKSTI